MTTTTDESTTESAMPPGPFSPMPLFPLDFGPLTTVPIDEQAKWAIGGGVALSWARQDISSLQKVKSLEDLIALLRERLSMLEGLSLITTDELDQTMQLVDDRRQGKPVAVPHKAGAVSVHSIIQGVVTRPSGQTTTESGIGDFFQSALHAVATAGAAFLGGLVGGPPGAVVGASLGSELINELFS